MANFRIVPTIKNEEMATEILKFTSQHPYYTQQLAFYCWADLEKNSYRNDMLNEVKGFLIKNDTYEIDDPFFAEWIVSRRNNV